MSETTTASELDPALAFQQWSAAAEATEQALGHWRAVSADTAGPLTELHDDARRNAAYWRNMANGMPRNEAWSAVEAEFGPTGLSKFVNYDPDDDEQDEA